MNIRRKFLRTLDLRVHQHMAGQSLISSYRLGRLNTVESLFSEQSDYRPVSFSTKPVETSAI